MFINSRGGYIDPSVCFDNYDYSKISIGNNVTISREVLFLLHDFSITTGLKAAKLDSSGYFLKEIKVGNNVFIGARVTLLPGTEIGDNSIIGAGAIVKGKIPENSVVIGNPAKIVGTTMEYGIKHYKMQDYIVAR